MTPNKYRKPHQGPQECARRLRQIRQGQLSGKSGHLNQRPFVSDEARYAAHGFLSPSDLQLVKP
jgi:hypothetical protein